MFYLEAGFSLFQLERFLIPNRFLTISTVVVFIGVFVDDVCIHVSVRIFSAHKTFSHNRIDVIAI